MELLRSPSQLAALLSDEHALLEAVAALDTFDGETLAAVYGAPIDETLDHLIGVGLVVPTERGYYVADKTPTSWADIVAGIPTARLRELDERAARHYAARLAGVLGAEGANLEGAYMRHFERLCETLMRQAPAELATAAAGAPIDLLAKPHHRHLVRYFHGVGAGLSGQLAAAQPILDALLAETDLDDALRARALNPSAHFAQHQGDYERAKARFSESYELWRRLGNPFRQGTVLHNMGIMHFELHEYAAAEACFRESAALFEAAGEIQYLAAAYNELGLVARDQGRWEVALSALRQAADNFERAGATDFLGRVANNIGEVELLCGRTDAAHAQFVQALTFMSTPVYAVDVHMNLGLVCQVRGDDAAALDCYRAALELARSQDRREVFGLIQARIGHAQRRLANLEAAQASYEAAIGAIEAAREPLNDEDLLISWMGRWQPIYEEAIDLALQRGAPQAAFEYAERARARAFADLLARRGPNLQSAKLEPVTAIETQAALPAGTLLLIYFALGLRGPEATLIDAIPSEASAVRACLQPTPQLMLLALTRDSIASWICPIDPNVLQAGSPYWADARRFMRAPVLRRLYDALIAPIEDLLAAADTVLVAPHGPLHQLSFAALLDRAGRPLLERTIRLSYTPSATVLLRALSARRSPADRACLAVGYDGPTELHLRHTEAEAAAIASLCAGEARRGTPGVRQDLVRDAGHYRWLHLACHGEFDTSDPLNSWLEIGPGERLTASEVIANLRLHADLVVLSACASGVSRIVRGDEPIGLVRAFLSAGARAVVVTLCPVEDLSARLLMERFYKELLSAETLDIAAALWAAQRYLRDLTDTDTYERPGGVDLATGLPAEAHPYADPLFWAPYVVMGGAALSFTSI